jgi:ABC-2 type transport system permease protein
VTATTRPAATAATTSEKGRRTGRARTATVLGVELRKLLAQRRSRYTLFGALVAPVIVTVVLKGQQRPPKDTLFGRHVSDSGFGLGLFALSFVSQWVLPFLTAIVAGDIFAGEDHLGTWKTVLTRSASRAQVFVAKCATAALFAAAVLVVLAVSTIASGLLIVGHQPLIGLTGQLIPASTALGLVSASWVSVLPPLLAFTAIAIALSVLSRNPAVGIVGAIVLGLASQMISWLGGMDPLRRLLPTTPFEAWHGLLTQHRFYDLITQGAWVSVAWIVACLGVAYWSFRRRDITGG